MANQFTGRTIWETFDACYVPEPNSGCWLWLRGCNSGGYGLLYDPSIKRQVQAHRISYTRRFGEIPDGLNVLHRCDVPACVNPDHLFLGTHAENMHDMALKGRHPYDFGADHTGAKLTDDDIRAIRASTDTHSAIARRFGIHKHSVYLIRKRKAWRHIL